MFCAKTLSKAGDCKHMKNLTRLAQEFAPDIIEWRRTLHRYPELAFQEFRSAEFVQKTLRKTAPQIEIKTLDKTGVLGILKSSRPGRTVVLRADLDALPIQEETGLPFASQNPGIMHACGHDGNTAILLGASAILSRTPFCGEIRFLFEPSEEKIPGGASRMIKAGALDGADCIFGIHVDASHPAGTFLLHAGPSMASCSQFTISITGKGGHAANSYECTDTIYTAAHLIVSLQSIISRRMDARENAVISITHIDTGQPSYNILPGCVTLRGTVRTLQETAVSFIQEELNQLIEHICLMNHVTGKMVWENGYPMVYNDPGMTKLAHDALSSQFENQCILEDRAVMGSEDFAVYLQNIPGCFIKAGTQKLQKGICYPHHHCKFDLDEQGLVLGAEGMARIALEAARI